jgi:CDP-diacylglycerol---glycerol-3-phosphate 3-phosphatidyltransferase
MLHVVRAPLARALMPIGGALARAGVSPDVVTLLGTVGVSAGALACYPSGRFVTGTLIITAFVFSDMLDGAVARARGGGSRWGAFLDSSLDRVGDAAIFSGLALYFAGVGNDNRLAALALYCLVAGLLTSYVRARAEGLGLRADVGIAERTERLVVILFATGLSGLFDYPPLLDGALWLLAAASTVTVVQRFVVVHRQVAGDAVPGSPSSHVPQS